MRCKTFQVISLCFPNPVSQHCWRVTTTLSWGTRGVLFSYFYISTVHPFTPWWQIQARGRSLCVQVLRGDDCAPTAATVQFPFLHCMTKWAQHGLYASCATLSIGSFQLKLFWCHPMLSVQRSPFKCPVVFLALPEMQGEPLHLSGYWQKLPLTLTINIIIWQHLSLSHFFEALWYVNSLA